MTERFEIKHTDSTVRATELFIAQLDKQIEELDTQLSLLQQLRAHAARTIGKDREGGTRMQRTLQATERSIKEGNSAEIDAELTEETNRALEALTIGTGDVKKPAVSATG